MSQREQVEIELLRSQISGGPSGLTARVTAAEAAITALQSQVSTLELEVAELQGIHGAEFSSAFSTAFWLGPQQ